LGAALWPAYARGHERAPASLAFPLHQAAAHMNRQEIEQRLTELAAEIEQAQSRVWLAEFERDQLRHALRRLIAAESKEVKP
jgi:hypothetical protein